MAGLFHYKDNQILIMDPLSQGLIGGLAAQVLHSEIKEARPQNKRAHVWASLCGFFGGVLPDADVFLRSATDPLYSLMIHRHFTHALAFIPIGGLIAACVMWIFLRNKLSFKRILAYSTIGVATHGFLDSATSYGTHLYWPFLDERTAWSFLPIIDPIVLLTMLFGFFAYLKSKSSTVIWSTVLILFLYMSFGFFQNCRVEHHLLNVAERRGHKIVDYHVQPTLFNTILWRGIYKTEDNAIHMDGYRSSITGQVQLYEGDQIELFQMPQSLDPETVLYNDIKRFQFFSRDFLAISPDDNRLLTDARYSMLPNSSYPLWGIRVDYNNPEQHIDYIHFDRDSEALLPQFKAMLKGEVGEPLSK